MVCFAKQGAAHVTVAWRSGLRGVNGVSSGHEASRRLTCAARARLCTQRHAQITTMAKQSNPNEGLSRSCRYPVLYPNDTPGISGSAVSSVAVILLWSRVG